MNVQDGLLNGLAENLKTGSLLGTDDYSKMSWIVFFINRLTEPL